MILEDTMEGNTSNNNGTPSDSAVDIIQKGMVKRMIADANRKFAGKGGSSASEFRGPKTPDLRKQAQENATMMKHAVFTAADADPAPKELAEQKPITTRVKKRDQPGSPRPKSWHTDSRVFSQPDLSVSHGPTRTSGHAQPVYHIPQPQPAGYNQFHSASESSFMNSTSYSEKSDYHHHHHQSGRSMSSLNNLPEDEVINPVPGHVQKKREAFERTILSQSMDKINEEQVETYSKRQWNEKQIITQGVNPKFRNIELEKLNLEPVETYPKVATGKHITSAQAKAVLGRVPEGGDHKGQWFGSVQDVSIHTVQMPQRQIASSADSSVTRNYAQSHSNLTNYPEPNSVQYHTSVPVGNAPYSGEAKSDRRVPPAIPKREDSKSRTQALSEHVKSSSWPATTTSTESTNTETVSQAILPSDLPPVKLNPNQEKAQTLLSVSLQSNPNKNANGATQEIFTAKPVWFDHEGGVFNYDESRVPNTESNFDASVPITGPPSPPTRDTDHVQLRQKSSRSTDDRFQTGDNLIQDYRKYLEQTEQQQENFRQSMELGDLPNILDQNEHLSKTHHFQISTQTQQVTESQQPLSQTMPARDTKRTSWYAEVEKRRKGSSASSQESVPFSETEMNRRNNMLGHNETDRTWRNPSDKRDEEWQHPQQAQPQQAQPQQPQPQQPTQPKKSSHSRQSSGIDDVNAPRMRSPITPMLMDSLSMKQDPLQQTFTQKIEKTGNRQESRDSRKSGIFEPGQGPHGRPSEGNGLSQDMAFDDNSILGRLKREGSVKDRFSYDIDRSEGNETSARKIVQPDTKRDLRNLGLTEEVFKTGKSLHYKSGSFTQDTRLSAAPVDSRLNKTVPELSPHQRTHSIDTAPYSRNPPRRRESMERRADSSRPVSRENSFADHSLAEARQFWKQKTSHPSTSTDDIDRGEHKKSKSDSDQHPRREQRQKNISDPANRQNTNRKSSDPENRQNIKDALVNYVNKNKRSPPGSVSSPLGSRQPSISGSEQSLLHSGMYTSNSSLASYSSSRHYGQDSISSVGSSFSQPLHHPQDSGFGSNSDISQVRSPHSPPQTGVISPKDVRMAASMSKQGNTVSRSASMNLPQGPYQPSNGERERRRSHQPRLHSEKDGRGHHMGQHQGRSHQNQRISLDSNMHMYRGQPETRKQSQRSPDERMRPSPTKQISPSYNVHMAERKAITRVQEEDGSVEPMVVYHSLQQDHTEASHQVFRFPPPASNGADHTSPASNPASQTPSQSTTGYSPSRDQRGLTTPPHPASGVDISPPPPPTPLTPWEGEMDFPPPPPELAPAEEKSIVLSPVRAACEQSVRLSPQEGSMPQMVTEQITPTFAEPAKQIPTGVLEVQVDTTPQARADDTCTTPSLSPNSVVSGRSTPDNHELETLPSPQHVPRLPSVQENIPFTLQSPEQNLKRFQDLRVSEPLSINNGGVVPRVDESDSEKEEEDEEEVVEEEVCEGSTILIREEEAAEREIQEQTDPLLKWVLQNLTPNRSALSDLFPLPKYKRSRSVGGTVKMTHMDPPTPTKSEEEVISEPRSPSECVNLVLSSSRYLRISPAKAIILKRARGMNAGDDLGNNNAELRRTQEQLVDRISKKVEEIKEMQNEVADEMAKLEEMGRDVMDSVKDKCKASEYNKCNMYIADIDRVTKLLLSLSRRLNKVESVLDSMENSEEEEKANLEKLKTNIHSQYQDAKVLKESIARRHTAISTILLNKVSQEKCDDFSHYVQMLPRLLIMAQELEDKVKLGDEQLEALRESLRQMAPFSKDADSCEGTSSSGSRDSLSGGSGGMRETSGRSGMTDSGVSSSVTESSGSGGIRETTSGSGGIRDTNGNDYRYGEEGQTSVSVSLSKSLSPVARDEVNSNATSSYC